LDSEIFDYFDKVFCLKHFIIEVVSDHKRMNPREGVEQYVEEFLIW